MTFLEINLWKYGRLTCLAAVIALSVACASHPPQPRPQFPPRNISAEVAAEFERSTAGWNSGNLNAFMAIYNEDATLALRDVFLEGYAAIRQHYAPQFARDADRGVLTLEEFNVQVLSPDLALVRGVYRNSQNREVIGRGTTSLLLRYLNGRWRIIHDHSS